jgi:D-alanyl-D-alanine carboxypeptidase
MTSRADPTATASVSSRVAVGSNAPIKPVLVKTITYRTAPLRTAALAPLPGLVPSRAAARPQAPVSAPRTVVASAVPGPIADAAPARSESQTAESAMIEAYRAEAAKPEMSKPEISRSEFNSERSKVASNSAPAPASTHAHTGWLIQIGAFDAENEAKQHLSAAQVKLHTVLAAADPFTERVQKGDKAFYRARFAGFDKTTAEAACRQLKRSDFECMTLKD